MSWKTSRGVRKFLRNRLALCALAIISGYVIVGIALMIIGWKQGVSLNASDPVGLSNWRGLSLKDDPERRLEDCELLLDTT